MMANKLGIRPDGGDGFYRPSLTPPQISLTAGVSDLDEIIFDLNTQIDLLTPHTDKLDCLVAMASGVLCALLDILWVGDFDLSRGREFGKDKVEDFVKKVAQLNGCEKDDLKNCVKYLEKKFPIPADKATNPFGGGLQHHLRDFAHHPSPVGLAFSLLTQFTYKCYGTDTNGQFLIVDLDESVITDVLIGKSVPDKLFKGTIIWLFHLVSDMAGSNAYAASTGGTGIPGPLLSLAKELSVLPFFRDMQIGEYTLSQFLSKLFNGTLFAKRDKNNRIIPGSVVKFDLRAEIGIAEEVARQAIPVVANDCIVRSFYLIRHLGIELKNANVCTLEDFSRISWDSIRPANNPTIDRMLTIACGVFTTMDVGEAALAQGAAFFVRVNYPGVGRFALALGAEYKWYLKRKNLAKLKEMYQTIAKYGYLKPDDILYIRLEQFMSLSTDAQFGLTTEQTAILYNIQYQKTKNDIARTTNAKTRALKKQWLGEWQQYMRANFARFLGLEKVPDSEGPTVELSWYDRSDLFATIKANHPKDVWYRLVLLEAMLFEPYFPLSTEKNKQGEEVPTTAYNALKCNRKQADHFLEIMFCGEYCEDGYIKRLRNCYDKVGGELNEILKNRVVSLGVVTIITLAMTITAGVFAPTIAVILVGSNFAGLSGAALTSACLAYLGGGAIAAGGAGMAGGVATIVGGGALLGGATGGIGGLAVKVGLEAQKAEVVDQSKKLLTAVREVFLNDEHNLELSDSVYEQYGYQVKLLEEKKTELSLKIDTASDEEKKQLKAEIKELEETKDAMIKTRKSLLAFKSSFETGLQAESEPNLGEEAEPDSEADAEGNE